MVPELWEEDQMAQLWAALWRAFAVPKVQIPIALGREVPRGKGEAG